MDVRRLLALFDEEVRCNPIALPGFTVERTGSVTRLSGPFNFVTWWELTDDDAAAAVAAQAAAVRSRVEGLHWRIYSHDRPPTLPDRLAESGFSANPPGTLMFLDLASVPDVPHDLDVQRVSSSAQLDDFMLTGTLAFGEPEPWRRAAYASRLDDPDLGIFVGYVEGKPAGSARLELVEGRRFGQLFGGGVIPEYRGRGLYRALVAVRSAEARRRGVRYLSTEARSTSRPILERMGFVPVATETTWVLEKGEGQES